MEELKILAGTSIERTAFEAYSKALSGVSTMFRFNGVQVIMFPDAEHIFQHKINKQSETPNHGKSTTDDTNK